MSNLIPNIKALWIVPLAGILAAIALADPVFAATYRVLHNFGSGQDGSGPLASVTVDVKGDIFGTTANGGANGVGVAFEISYSPGSGWVESILHNLDFHLDGANPDNALAIDQNGKLYGTTAFGGPQLIGTVFELTPNGNAWNFNLIYEMGTHGGVVLDAAGHLYSPLGAGDNIGGAIGELSPAQGNWAYTQLHSFCTFKPQCWDGILPQGPLAWDGAGNLYGTTSEGGEQPPVCAQELGCGVAFRLRHLPDGTWAYHVLHWFGSFPNDGQSPNASLVVDSKGNVYGTTLYGGPNFFPGTVFKLSPHPPGQGIQCTGYLETILYSFPDCNVGCTAFGTLALDKEGNLYGAAGGGNHTCAGGNSYCGVIYRLAPQPNGTWKYSVVHKFNGVDGFGPTGITLGGDGNLYGTTYMGGQFNLGVAFEITP